MTKALWWWGAVVLVATFMNCLSDWILLIAQISAGAHLTLIYIGAIWMIVALASFGYMMFQFGIGAGYTQGLRASLKILQVLGGEE